MKTFELDPINGKKSFYGKCKVIEENRISYLYSYDLLVAYYNDEKNTMKVNGYYSQTTASHINAFLNYYGFKTCTKKELKNYNN